MKLFSFRLLPALTLFAVLLISFTSFADIPGAHPRLLHSLTDLRAARWHLEHRGGSPELKTSDQAAIVEIDHCIDAVKKAAADDGKNLAVHPGEDAGKDKAGNVHRARELLKSARRDIAENESNAAASPLRDQALTYLDQALAQVEASLKIKK